MDILQPSRGPSESETPGAAQCVLTSPPGTPVSGSNYRARAPDSTVVVVGRQGAHPALVGGRGIRWLSSMHSCRSRFHLYAHHPPCVASARDCPRSSGQLKPRVFVPGLLASPSHVRPSPLSTLRVHGIVHQPLRLKAREPSWCVSRSGQLVSASFSLHHTTLAFLPRTTERDFYTPCSFHFHPEPVAAFHKVDQVSPLLETS